MGADYFLFFLGLGEDNIWPGGGDARDGEPCSGRTQADAKGCDRRELIDQSSRLSWQTCDYRHCQSAFGFDGQGGSSSQMCWRPGIGLGMISFWHTNSTTYFAQAYRRHSLPNNQLSFYSWISQFFVQSKCHTSQGIRYTKSVMAKLTQTAKAKCTILNSIMNKIYQINDDTTYLNSPGKIVWKLFFNSNNYRNLNLKRHRFDFTIITFISLLKTVCTHISCHQE